MIKITRNKRKSDRVKYLNILKEVGDTQYCGWCKYKKYTGEKTDYYVYDNGADKIEYVKVHRRSVFCALDKRRTLDDCVLSDGLKVCGFKDWYGNHIK